MSPGRHGQNPAETPDSRGPPLASSRFHRSPATIARVAPLVSKARKAELNFAWLLALIVAALLVVAGVDPGYARPSAGQSGASYLAARQTAGGGFAEPGRPADPALTAWVVLALEASGGNPAALTRNGNSPADYLVGKPYPTATDLELRILALDALGQSADASRLGETLAGLRKPSGRIGPGVNSTIWGVIALRAVGRSAGKTTVSYLLRSQTAGGGWSWARGVAADSNDTAAAIQALVAAGVSGNGSSITRGLAYLRRLQNPDGGFELSAGRGSDAQSTAWAIQAFLAGRKKPGKAAFAYLARLRRQDGSYRYSARYGITPTWVTAQVLPALARRSSPSTDLEPAGAP